MPPTTSRPMRTVPPSAAELVDQLGDGGRRVLQLAVEPHDAVGVDGRDPVHLLGDVDPDADPHGAPRAGLQSGIPPAPSSPYTAMIRRA